MNSNKGGHGGKRTPGPGKKLGPPLQNPETGRKQPVTLTLSPDLIAWADMEASRRRSERGERITRSQIVDEALRKAYIAALIV